MDFRSLTVAAEFGVRTKASSYPFFETDGFAILPAFLMFGKNIDDWNVALGYMNYFDYSARGPELPETTPQHPEGTGRVFREKKDVATHSFFSSASTGSENVKYGLTLGVNYVTYSDELVVNFKTSNSGIGVLLSAGALVKPSDRVDVGLAVKYTSPVTFDVTFFQESNSYQASLPWSVELGFKAAITNSFSALGSIEYQHWTKAASNVDNKVQFHFGAIVGVSSTENIRCGFFTQLDPNKTWGEYYDQLFLTLGIQTIRDNMAFSLTLLDSHLFANKDFWSTLENKQTQFHQTMISVGGSYSFE